MAISSITMVKTAADLLEYLNTPMSVEDEAAERVVRIIEECKREDRRREASNRYFHEAKADGWYMDRLGLLVDRNDR